ncbi:hypothetical protein HF521_008855 [Silurus meridionalis]|uniref:CMP/dCMP-type deaminase domain-containing protein n=1 Tax=Silurus meridionalis TaxID=175797 RepID=A0A8T0ALI6_SILME|nr:hypothetical protein HF521_008855 [Silurus meridionalis]
MTDQASSSGRLRKDRVAERQMVTEEKEDKGSKEEDMNGAFQYKNVEYSSGRNKTFLCYLVNEVRGAGDEAILRGFVEDEHASGDHAEDAFFRLVLPHYNASARYNVTWYVSSSPCPSCAAKLVEILRERKTLRLTIFSARLFEWEEPEHARCVRTTREGISQQRHFAVEAFERALREKLVRRAVNSSTVGVSSRSHHAPVWVARNPPGFAFVEFEDPRDATDAVRELDGRTLCGCRVRVELSNGEKRSRNRGPPPSWSRRPRDDYRRRSPPPRRRVHHHASFSATSEHGPVRQVSTSPLAPEHAALSSSYSSSSSFSSNLNTQSAAAHFTFPTNQQSACFTFPKLVENQKTNPPVGGASAVAAADLCLAIAEGSDLCLVIGTTNPHAPSPDPEVDLGRTTGSER